MVHNVTRDCGGSYVCEASNGVEPQQSREMKVVVQCKYTSLPNTYKYCQVKRHTLYIQLRRN